ncbi:MAG: hypothetical protein WCL07_04470 [bacterium]
MEPRGHENLIKLDGNTILESVESHLFIQPQSIQDMFVQAKPIMKYAAAIGEQTWIFSHKNNAEILGWVSDPKTPNRFRTRVFRFSDSDNQWKSLPGLRANGDYMKGDENSSYQHYVQDAKLSKEMYMVINALPFSVGIKTPDYTKFLPGPGESNNKYKAEFEFRNEQVDFADPNWQIYAKWLRQMYDYYRAVIQSPKQNFNNVDSNWPVKDYPNINRVIHNIQRNPRNDEVFQTHKGIFDLATLSTEVGATSQALIKAYNADVSKRILAGFRQSGPRSITPDFNKIPINRYIKKGKITNPWWHGNTDINIEEYQVESDRGDQLIYAMARDSRGRSYIDNIYSPHAKQSSYGTLTQVVNMGFLVYKPDDYKDNINIGFPEGYAVAQAGQYLDISKLWAEIPVIKKYREIKSI